MMIEIGSVFVVTQLESRWRLKICTPTWSGDLVDASGAGGGDSTPAGTPLLASIDRRDRSVNHAA